MGWKIQAGHRPTGHEHQRGGRRRPLLDEVQAHAIRRGHLHVAGDRARTGQAGHEGGEAEEDPGEHAGLWRRSAAPCQPVSDSAERVMADDGDGGGARQAIAVILLLAMLVGAGLFLTGALGGAARVQDCVASGRTNCAPLKP